MPCIYAETIKSLQYDRMYLWKFFTYSSDFSQKNQKT